MTKASIQLTYGLVELDKTRLMNKLNSIFSTIIICVSFSLIGCSEGPQTEGSSSLFNTKIQAENAAKKFNCTGAHKMGDKWMPCNSHAANEEAENHKSNYGDHHDR